jgi:ADP-ribose pyrophosphatase YjhB (NUDIX family)
MIFIRCEYKGTQGILLVKRLNYPVKGVYWPIGGRVLRGVTTEESLQKKVLDECSLILFRLTYLATARTFFKDEPFGHTKGTDTLNLIFIADGLGTINLNSAHTDPMIVTKDSYPTLRESFVPYVQTYLDHIDKENLW